MSDLSKERRKLLRSAFRMPSVPTMVSRKTTIANAFVCSLIPVFRPTEEEIEEALAVLEMTPDDVRCAYCGDKSTEWDHLNALVRKGRPTGYVSEIANLVPACGKCNQSKGNSAWHEWMMSDAERSPKARGIPNVESRVQKLRAYEHWRPATVIDFSALIGEHDSEHYWKLCDAVNADLKEAQEFAKVLRLRVLEKIRK